MANGDVKASELNGIFIYNEDKRTVYYDIFNKTAYIIADKDAYDYSIYSTFMLVSLVASALIVNVFSLKAWVGVILEIAFLIIIRVYFRLKYLSKLSKLDGFKPYHKEFFLVSMAKQFSYKRLLVLLGLLLLLGASMHVYALDFDPTSTTYFSDTIIAYMCYLLSAFIVITLIIKKIKNL